MREIVETHIVSAVVIMIRFFSYSV